MSPSLNVINLHALLLLLFYYVLLAPPSLGTSSTSTATNITANVAGVSNSSFFVAKPGCPLTCGNLTVPYPFGIGAGCSVNSYFEINCSSLFSPPKPFLPNGNIEVLSISQTQIRIKNLIAMECFNSTGDTIEGDNSNYEVDFEVASRFRFSDTDNKFMVVGCDDVGTIVGTTADNQTLAAGLECLCFKDTDLINGSCTGLGCCQTAIPKGVQYFSIQIDSINNHTKVPFDPCGYTFVGETDDFQFYGLSDLTDPLAFQDRILNSVPVVLDFSVDNQSCAEAAQNSSSYLCTSNALCIDNTGSGAGGYICSCKTGYEGNPYLSSGCTDIDECEPSNGYLLNDCVKNAICINTPGSFNCSCQDPYDGNGKIYCIRKASSSVLKISLGLSIPFLSILITVTWLYFCIKRRKLIKLREKFFQQNGGSLMKEKISSNDGLTVESSKFFTVEELKKATNNYAEDRILGQGGNGVVYRGILADQRVVAIKKSKVIDLKQVEQFINELLILTKVNHMNVVKILGCCFESEVPELVYEYVSNGTLYQHIHRTTAWLTLDNRLRITKEIASALSYLHSDASIPIIHRDVKSTNILLDSNHVAKMADFGASRLVPLDQTQATTLVQGTLGYLDPEYIQSGQLTEKSDVYSFGVVLAELLTGKKAICLERPEGDKSLAHYFNMSMKENRWFETLDPQVVREGTLEQLQAIAELVKRCLCLPSEVRPAMKEVVTELERLRNYKKDPRVNQQSHEESGNFLSEEAQEDSYTEPISPFTTANDISGNVFASNSLAR